MRYGGKELRKAYYDLLTNAITVSGQTIKCFDTIAPDGEPKPYILLSTYFQQGNNSSKTSFGCNATMTIDILDAYDGTAFSRVKVDDIANQVIGLVRPNLINKGLALTNFDVISVNLQGNTEVFLEQQEEQTFRNILIFEHILTEK